MQTFSARVPRLRISQVAGFLLAGTLLSGCGGVTLIETGPAPNVFDLTPPNRFVEGLPDVDWQLVVEEPQAALAVDTDRIAVKNDFELQYYSGARWSDRAPRMVQTRLLESFENTGHILAVGRQAIGFRGDYTLRTELREFQAEYNERYGNFVESVEGGSTRGDPVINARVNFKIIRQPDAKIVASATFRCERQAADGDLISVVKGFDETLGWILTQSVGWTLQEANADHISRREGLLVDRSYDAGYFDCTLNNDGSRRGILVISQANRPVAAPMTK